MFLLPALVISYFIVGSVGQQCPAVYLRFTPEHSFCKPKNPSCPMYASGMSDQYRQQILDIHNKYRSQVAMGLEKRAGGLPQAADMMQMVWDNEMEGVAQKWAEQCIYEHDCGNCRRVENFAVGQNIAYREMMCPGSKCPHNSTPDWESVIKNFYDEVEVFNKKYIKSMEFEPGKVYGHFTQVSWASSWRIGCGFVAFEKDTGYRQFYVCNYGPSGNTKQMSMYQEGKPCSACPINSCCGGSCGKMDYKGLCKMNKNTEAPVYPKPADAFYFCDFRSQSGDCSVSTKGASGWKFIQALGGPYAEIVLNGGETSTLVFNNPVKPSDSKFCLMPKVRYGPTVAGQQVALKATLEMIVGSAAPMTMNLGRSSIDGLQFMQTNINLSWNTPTKVSITVSVPSGSPSQFFDINLLSAKNGRC